jgi:hypothetical protein
MDYTTKQINTGTLVDESKEIEQLRKACENMRETSFERVFPTIKKEIEKTKDQIKDLSLEEINADEILSEKLEIIYLINKNIFGYSTNDLRESERAVREIVWQMDEKREMNYIEKEKKEKILKMINTAEKEIELVTKDNPYEFIGNATQIKNMIKNGDIYDLKLLSKIMKEYNEKKRAIITEKINCRFKDISFYLLLGQLINLNNAQISILENRHQKEKVIDKITQEIANKEEKIKSDVKNMSLFSEEDIEKIKKDIWSLIKEIKLLPITIYKQIVDKNSEGIYDTVINDKMRKIESYYLPALNKILSEQLNLLDEKKSTHLKQKEILSIAEKKLVELESNIPKLSEIGIEKMFVKEISKQILNLELIYSQVNQIHTLSENVIISPNLENARNTIIDKKTKILDEITNLQQQLKKQELIKKNILQDESMQLNLIKSLEEDLQKITNIPNNETEEELPLLHSIKEKLMAIKKLKIGYNNETVLYLITRQDFLDKKNTIVEQAIKKIGQIEQTERKAVRQQILNSPNNQPIEIIEEFVKSIRPKVENILKGLPLQEMEEFLQKHENVQLTKLNEEDQKKLLEECVSSIDLVNKKIIELEVLEMYLDNIHDKMISIYYNKLIDDDTSTLIGKLIEMRENISILMGKNTLAALVEKIINFIYQIEGLLTNKKIEEKNYFPPLSNSFTKTLT